MLKKIYLLSFGLFFVLPIVSILVKIVLHFEIEFVLIDVWFLGIAVGLYWLCKGFYLFCKQKDSANLSKIGQVWILPHLIVSAFVIFFWHTGVAAQQRNYF